MSATDDRRGMLQALASGGSAGARAYQEYSAQVAQADAQAYGSLTGRVGGDPAYRNLLSQYTDPYAADATAAGQMWGEQVGFEQIAGQKVGQDYREDLGRQRYEMAMRNQIEDVQRAAQNDAAAAQSATGGSIADMSQWEQKGLAAGVANELMARDAAAWGEEAKGEQKVATTMYRKADSADEAVRRIKAEQAQFMIDMITQGSAPSLSGVPTTAMSMPGETGWDQLAGRIGAAQRQSGGFEDRISRAADKGIDMRLQAGERMSGVGPLRDQIAMQPLQRDEYGAQALQMMGYDPYTAQGLANEWFPASDVTAEMQSEQEAANMLMYGNPDGAEGALHDQLAGQNDQQDAYINEVVAVTGIPRQAIASAANDLVLPVEQVAATLASDAWADVDAKAREFAAAGDARGFEDWLTENADPLTDDVALSIYAPLFED